MLQAHLLRQQDLTLRQIATRMNCAHSTVAGYLADFERYRSDLIQELAADQLVTHLIQLADPEAATTSATAAWPSCANSASCSPPCPRSARTRTNASTNSTSSESMSTATATAPRRSAVTTRPPSGK